jgi:hypothetical protein
MSYSPIILVVLRLTQAKQGKPTIGLLALFTLEAFKERFEFKAFILFERFD